MQCTVIKTHDELTGHPTLTTATECIMLPSVANVYDISQHFQLFPRFLGLFFWVFFQIFQVQAYAFWHFPAYFQFFFWALGDVFPEMIFATRASIRGFSKFAFVPPCISILFYMEIHEIDALTSYEVICSCPCLNQFFEREGCQDFYFEFSHVSHFTNGNHVWHRIY